MQPNQTIRIALLFYGAMAAVAFAWGGFAGRPVLFLDPTVSSWSSAAVGAGAGLALGLLVVALSRALERTGWVQRIIDWFASLLGPLSWSQAAILAVLSALGEELLFRGAMQPSWGVPVTALLFAAMHVPSRRDLWPWTVSAGLLGLAFGLMTEWTGNLAGPIVAHFTINLLNLKRLSSLATLPLLRTAR